MQKHIGEKPLSYLMCGSGFSGKSNLKRYTGTHTAEQLFPCEICRSTFSHYLFKQITFEHIRDRNHFYVRSI